ncbi:hypothetical protein PVW47_04060 [Marinovum sp. SP66]|uniref:hypothetical protein n=1 Tax=Marinovum TaxID=367771 RepID=UPI00237BA5A6|nr:hypothetical protein [Marinovum sp. SP66]MDD9738957.1 hypothetical protein [Marinovum sp. SP66]
MLEMLMLLGTGLAAAGIAGMTGIGSQSEDSAAEPASAAAKDYDLGEDYEGGEGEDLLSQVRRMGASLDLAKFMPGSAGADSAGGDDAAGETAADADNAPEEDETSVDWEALMVPPEGLDAGDYPQEIAEDVAQDDAAVQPTLDEDAASEPESETVTGEAESNTVTGEAESNTVAPEPESDTVTEEAESVAEPAEDDDVPVISDFAAGAEQLLLMLPEGMGEDTKVSIEPSGSEGMDAAVVLEDDQGGLTAVIVAGAYGTLNAADVVLERDG